MDKSSLYSLLLVTACLFATGGRELARGNWALGFMMVSIPIAGWTAVILGK